MLNLEQLTQAHKNGDRKTIDKQKKEWSNKMGELIAVEIDREHKQAKERINNIIN